MNRFCKLGFVEYNRRIRVYKSLLNVILHDQLPDDNAVKPDIPNVPPKRPKTARAKPRVHVAINATVYQDLTVRLRHGTRTNSSVASTMYSEKVEAQASSAVRRTNAIRLI
jgi:hypothetical protein